MAFDAEGYRKAAKAAGIPDDEIEKDIAEEMGNIKPVNAPPQKSDVQIGGQYDWLIPAAVGTGVGIATTGALGLGGKAIKDRWMSKPAEAPRIEPSIDQSRYAGPGRIEPTMDAAPVATEAPPKSPYSAQDLEMIQKSEQNRLQKAAEAETKKLQSAVPGAVAPAAPVAPVAPVAAAPVPAVPSVEQAVATGQSPTQAVEAQVAKEIDATPAKPAEVTPAKNKGGRPRKDAVKPPVPESEVGLTKQQIGMKRHLESFYGGGEVGTKTYNQVKDILGYTPEYPLGSGGGLSPEENAKIKAFRKENVPGPKVNLTHEMKKTMKGGAGLAVLAAIPGFAEAAQQKDLGKMADIASDFFVLPFAQSGTAGMSKAEEEAIIASKFKESKKLGSPYRSVPPPGQ